VAGPGDETAAGVAGHGRMRASHADREQVIEALKVAFVDGRLTKDELGTLAGVALSPAGERQAARPGSPGSRRDQLPLPLPRACGPSSRLSRGHMLTDESRWTNRSRSSRGASARSSA
jgi:hypothetical protein